MITLLFTEFVDYYKMDYLNKFIQESNAPRSEPIIKQIASLTHRFSQIEVICCSKRNAIVAEFVGPPPGKEREEGVSCTELIMRLNQEGGNERGGEKKQDISPEIEFPDRGDLSKKDELCAKVYKKLALVIHPDKSNNPDHIEMFPIAGRAHEEYNLPILVYLAQLVKVCIKFTEEDADILSDEVNALESKISSLKASMFFQWDTLSQKQKDAGIEMLKKINKEGAK